MHKHARGQTYRERDLTSLGYKLKEQPVGWRSKTEILIQNKLSCQINEKMTEGSHLQQGRDIIPYKHLGKISDNLHPNNQNNWLKRRAQPPREVPLNAQSWTQVSSLSSRVVAVTTTIYTSQMLAQVPCIRFPMDFSSRSALEDGSKLRQVNTT